MFDIGLQELVLIFVIALLVFGPKNLPQLGRSMGRAMREFRRASDEFRSTIETNLQMNDLDPPPSTTTRARVLQAGERGQGRRVHDLSFLRALGAGLRFFLTCGTQLLCTTDLLSGSPSHPGDCE